MSAGIVESTREMAARLTPESLDLASLERYLLAALILLVGLVIASWAKRLVVGLSSRRLSNQQTMIAGRATYYLVAGIVLLEALHTAGVELGVLLGAAGILTVAIGFAAQTSASNLISGLFLMGEKPFVLGDVIEIGTTTGEVVSIDLLSVKLRTFDNVLVRLPNESLLKTEIKNLTRFPIRRLDIPLLFSFREDPERIAEVLRAVAEVDDFCLDEPKPTLFALDFAESGLRMRFTAWAARENFIEMKNRLLPALLRALREASVDFAVPRRDLGGQEPLTVRLARDDVFSEAIDEP